MKPESIKASGDQSLWNPSLLTGRKKDFFAILVEQGIDSSKLNRNIIDDLFDIACEKKTYTADELRKKIVIKRNKYLKDNAGKISISITRFKTAKPANKESLIPVIPQNVSTVKFPSTGRSSHVPRLVMLENSIEGYERLANTLAIEATKTKLNKIDNITSQSLSHGIKVNAKVHSNIVEVHTKASNGNLSWQDIEHFFDKVGKEQYDSIKQALLDLKKAFPNADMNIFKALMQIINEEIFLPSKVVSFLVGDGSEYQGVIPDEPEIFITPNGNEIPVYTLYPVSGSFLKAQTLSKSIVYPIERDFYNNLLASGIISSYKSESKIERGSFVDESYKLFDWIILELITSCKDPIDVIRKDTYVEELEHSDTKILAVQRFGRRIFNRYPGELANEAKSVLKPNSYLLKKLLEITNIKEQDIFAEGIIEIRARIAALKRSPFPPLAFIDCAGYKLMGALQVGDKEHYDMARTESLKLLSPHIIGHNGEEINFEKWHKYLDSRLRFHIKGHSDVMSDEVKQFNLDLKIAADAILEEHFYLK